MVPRVHVRGGGGGDATDAACQNGSTVAAFSCPFPSETNMQTWMNGNGRVEER